jgi:hypothetical protein
MAIVDGQTDVGWRFQGLKSCCWLTAIEMMMQWKHRCIYSVDKHGQPRTRHTDMAMIDFKKNKGSHIVHHASEYGLTTKVDLKNELSLDVWRAALNAGPVLAEGRYGLARMGWGNHVIVIVGISKSGKLAYYNPNIFAFFPHTKSKLTYFSVERCIELSSSDGMMDGPFWQLR